MKPALADRVLERLKGFTEALERGDAIPDRFTCRQIEINVKPAHYNPRMVRATRNLLGISQAVFAKFLGVGVKTVSSWEQGLQKPSSMACRFLDEIARDPKYWRKRLQESVRLKRPAASA